MNKAKLINGQLDYFHQPEWILGDASQYATEQGYKDVVYSEQPILEANQYTKQFYTETETEIIVSYEVLTTEPTVHEPTLEEKVTELQSVIVELTTKLNEKNIIP